MARRVGIIARAAGGGMTLELRDRPPEAL